MSRATEAVESRAPLWVPWLSGLMAVWMAWGLLLLSEMVVVALLYTSEFSGAWEAVAARDTVVPIGMLFLFPLAFAETLAQSTFRTMGEGTPRSRKHLALLVLVLVALCLYFSTGGRHFARGLVRVSTVVFGSAALSCIVYGLAPWFWKCSPLSRALLALAFLVSTWLADHLLLVRLYPSIHLLWAFCTLSGAAYLGRFFEGLAERRGRLWLMVFSGLLLVAFAFWVPRAKARLHQLDNLKLVLVERAPLLGRVVRLLPEEPHRADPRPTASRTDGTFRRWLDFGGHDVVLLTVDALRADHVSALGYARRTTPNVDALAREGTLFRRAYTPTPHTSYAVTSLMAGKYMRPLLLLGLAESSDLWASYLRRYGYQTAAFYPPAVFFVDTARFRVFEENHLDFEYAKVEFADPPLRKAQVASYLDGLTDDRPVFLWVHFFEPHEPYVRHEGHHFGDTAVDLYDGEIAYADEGIGEVVRLVRQRRPGAVFVVTSDHGEEFGEHGGRYHGTTVYDEQVRVPLVVVGPGVRRGESHVVVQTIDILPTVLSALGIPRPARVRGRDLGPILAGVPSDQEPGLAHSETEDYALLAQGEERLVCARKIGACTLYRTESDPEQRHDLSHVIPARKEEMRRLLTRLEEEHGTFERGTSEAWPDALRRGLLGDADAAKDVALLLEDANVDVRRKAAEVLYQLHPPGMELELTRASRDEDETVRRYAVLARLRALGTPESHKRREGPLVEAASELLRSGDLRFRRAAALALSEAGDPRAKAELVEWWRAEGPPHGALEFRESRELLTALYRIRAEEAVPYLVSSLEDVRLRPFVAEALGRIGDKKAIPALAKTFAEERYLSARAQEAEALLALGAVGELAEPLSRFAGVVEPLPEALGIAERAGILAKTSFATPKVDPEIVFRLPTRQPYHAARSLRLLVRSEGLELGVAVLGRPVTASRTLASSVTQHDFDVDGAPRTIAVTFRGHIRSAWLVWRADEIPPPAPRPFGPSPPRKN